MKKKWKKQRNPATKIISSAISRAFLPGFKYMRIASIPAAMKIMKDRNIEPQAMSKKRKQTALQRRGGIAPKNGVFSVAGINRLLIARRREQNIKQ